VTNFVCEVLAADVPAEQSPFASFLMGGFEGATFSFWDGRRVDVISSTRHDRKCLEDYNLLASVGVKTVRDSFRWPLIEQRPGWYDWSSVGSMLSASVATNTQVIWDLCHFGVPDCVDAMALDFPQRFAAYAQEAAAVVKSMDARPQWWCPINEISYWAHAAGQAAYMRPSMEGRSEFLKIQFAHAFLAARAAILSVDPRSRFIATDPLICVTDAQGAIAETERSYGYEAWDMLLGVKCPEMEGGRGAVDVIGVNYYSDNQWSIPSRATVGMGQRAYRPLRLLLGDVWKRYGKPIILSETSAEGENLDNWLAYVASEVKSAREAGVQVLGICIYPVMDYPGWLDNRHCPCGLIELDTSFDRRTLRPLSRENNNLWGPRALALDTPIK
jgi:beta-glucosidase/6-phospho-beta-glucosidase/beta-galactosidase